MAKNVLVLVHGMVPSRTPSTSRKEYADFREGMLRAEPTLAQALEPVVEVSWGHEQPDQQVERHDQKLTRAQQQVADRVEYDAVRSQPSPNNVLLTGVFGRDYAVVPPMRFISKGIREGIVQFGLADAMYYASADGEKRVRATIYEQILEGLGAPGGAGETRLHVVCHSLGVAVMHDFLYGLFHSGDAAPDFLNQATNEVAQRYGEWRENAKNETLKLGTLVTMASQLPLFHMRKQTLVDRFYLGKTLDAKEIGVAGDAVRWLNFYDVDDILGFATRPLYGDDPAIKELQVDTGDNPISAHTAYWHNKTVTRESARLILKNCS